MLKISQSASKKELSLHVKKQFSIHVPSKANNKHTRNQTINNDLQVAKTAQKMLNVIKKWISKLPQDSDAQKQLLALAAAATLLQTGEDDNKVSQYLNSQRNTKDDKVSNEKAHELREWYKYNIYLDKIPLTITSKGKQLVVNSVFKDKNPYLISYSDGDSKFLVGTYFKQTNSFHFAGNGAIWIDTSGNTFQAYAYPGEKIDMAPLYNRYCIVDRDISEVLGKKRDAQYMRVKIRSYISPSSGLPVQEFSFNNQAALGPPFEIHALSQIFTLPAMLKEMLD